MNTDQLIESLAADLAPVPRNAVSHRIGLGIALGAVGTVALVAFWLGFNPDLHDAVTRYPFWMKWFYTLSLAVCAVAATARLARPDGGALDWLWLMAIPVLSLAAISIFEMSRVPSAQWLAMWLGESWKVCSSLVFRLSLPIFGGLMWSFRGMAPTRLRAAGATAGLTAGAWAAMLYCLHCPEVSAIFVLSWYTLGIAMAALAGAIIGPRLMRW